MADLTTMQNAIFEIRDSLAEIRDILRSQKRAQEKAMQESGTAKEVLNKMMEAFPPNIRSMMDPLTKRG